MQIEFTDKLDSEIEDIKSKDLEEYKTSHGIDLNHHPFAIVAKNEKEEVVGTVVGYTVYCEIYIDDLWVHSKYRRMGYGKALIMAVEERFSNKGFNNINLVTNEFQAPEFDRKCGFELEFVRQNVKNPKLTHYCVVKYFSDEMRHQGILRSEV